MPIQPWQFRVDLREWQDQSNAYIFPTKFIHKYIKNIGISVDPSFSWR